jgi:hypothetical protein
LDLCRWLAPAVATFCLASAVAVPNADSADEKGDGKLIRFELVDEKTNAKLVLDVPAKYTNRRARRGPENGLLVIETGLPDLRPRPALIDRKAPAGTPEAEREDRFIKDGVIVDLRGKVVTQQYPINVMRNFPKWQDRLPDDVPGFRRYGSCDWRDKKAERERQADPARAAEPPIPCRQVGETEEYVPEAYVPGEPWAHFHCARPNLGWRAYCSGRGLYRQRDFAFTIRRTELARWKEFDRAARLLLDRFVVFDSLSE